MREAAVRHSGTAVLPEKPKEALSGASLLPIAELEKPEVSSKSTRDPCCGPQSQDSQPSLLREKVFVRSGRKWSACQRHSSISICSGLREIRWNPFGSPFRRVEQTLGACETTSFLEPDRNFRKHTHTRLMEVPCEQKINFRSLK